MTRRWPSAVQLERAPLAAAIALVLATGSLLASPITPEAAAADDGPWLAAVAPGSRVDVRFERFSGDGTHLTVSSTADPLTDTTGTGIWDVGNYEFDRLTPDNTQVIFAGASPDGTAVVFATSESLLAEDTDSMYDLYMAVDGSYELVTPGTADPVLQAFWIADRGDLVLFHTREALTSDDQDGNESDGYLWDRATGAVRLPSPLPGASLVGWNDSGSRLIVAQPGGETYDWVDGATTYLATGTFKGVSPDGERVYLVSRDQLVPEDSDASYDAYVFDDGGVHLLSPGQTADVELGGFSSDGSRWILTSYASLLPEDLDTKHDNYLATADDLVLLPSGDEDAWLVGVADDLSTGVIRTYAGIADDDLDGSDDLYRWVAADPSLATLLTSGSNDRLPTLKGISPNGRRIIIETAEPLLPEDPESSDLDKDVYEWFDGVLTNLSPNSALTVAVAGVSRDARRVAFVTQANLVPEDRTSGADLYLSDRLMQPPLEPIRDVRPPVGTVAVGQGGFATSRDVTLGVPATDARGSVVTVRVSNDGVTFKSFPYEPSIPWTLSAGDGPKTVSVTWTDSANNRSDPVVMPVVLDTVAPVVSPVTRALQGGTTIIGGAVALRLAWTGTETGSGIDRYEIQRGIDRNGWVDLPSQTESVLDVRLLSQVEYGFRVRAIDRAGLASPWTSSSTWSLTKYGEANSQITYQGRWKVARDASYLGGAARRATKAGRTASLTFTGRTVAWVSDIGPGRGKARIFVDGAKVATVDLYSATKQSRRIVFATTWTTSATRTITIYVVGTSGRPAVDLDAMVSVH